MQFIGQHLKIKLTLNYDHEVVWIMLSWLLAYSFRELWKKFISHILYFVDFLLLIPFASLNENLYKERKTKYNIKCLTYHREMWIYMSVNLINWTKTNWVGSRFFFWFANFLYFYRWVICLLIGHSPCSSSYLYFVWQPLPVKAFSQLISTVVHVVSHVI